MDRCILVRHEGELYVQRDATLYNEPLAVRMWWRVSSVRYGGIGVDDGPPLGEELTSLHQHEVGRAQYRAGMWNIFLPNGGRTEACRRWMVEVPPPRNARVVQVKWHAERGDVTWHQGSWVKQLARSEKNVPIKWDRLPWRETPLEAAEGESK